MNQAVSAEKATAVPFKDMANAIRARALVGV
jgi:hypothetical protein